MRPSRHLPWLRACLGGLESSYVVYGCGSCEGQNHLEDKGHNGGPHLWTLGGYGTAFEDKNGNTYSPEFAKIGDAFGCYAEKISKKEEIIPALQRAAKSSKPSVIEIEVQREFPFTGSPAVGWWDVPIPEYLTVRRKKYEEEMKGEKL